MLQDSRYCAHCERRTMHQANGTNHVLHFFLTLLTAGLWLFVWIGLVVWRALSRGGYRCVKCGVEN